MLLADAGKESIGRSRQSMAASPWQSSKRAAKHRFAPGGEGPNSVTLVAINCGGQPLMKDDTPRFALHVA